TPGLDLNSCVVARAPGRSGDEIGKRDLDLARRRRLHTYQRGQPIGAPATTKLRIFAIARFQVALEVRMLAFQVQLGRSQALPLLAGVGENPGSILRFGGASGDAVCQSARGLLAKRAQPAALILQQLFALAE